MKNTMSIKNTFTLTRVFSGNKITFHAEFNDHSEEWVWTISKNGVRVDAGCSDNVWAEAQSQLTALSMDVDTDELAE